MSLTLAFQDLIKLFSREGRKFYFFLHRTAGYWPRSTAVFRRAFVHKSVAASLKPGGIKPDNERLEFLGDAILEAVVTDILFRRFPGADEGFLSKLRSNMVCRARLNAIAFELGLDQYIVVSSRKDLAVSHIPGDALEAFVASIYLDGGLGRVRRFALRHIANERRIEEARMGLGQDNFKSRLVNLGDQSGVEVFFETHRLSGVDVSCSAVNFVSEVKVADVVIGRGEGRTKKQAEQMAAQRVLGGIEHGDIELTGCRLPADPDCPDDAHIGTLDPCVPPASAGS